MCTCHTVLFFFFSFFFFFCFRFSSISSLLSRPIVAFLLQSSHGSIATPPLSNSTGRVVRCSRKVREALSSLGPALSDVRSAPFPVIRTRLESQRHVGGPMDVSSCITAPASVAYYHLLIPSSSPVSCITLSSRDLSRRFRILSVELFILYVYYLLSRFAAVVRRLLPNLGRKRKVRNLYILCVFEDGVTRLTVASLCQCEKVAAPGPA